MSTIVSDFPPGGVAFESFFPRGVTLGRLLLRFGCNFRKVTSLFGKTGLRLKIPYRFRFLP